MHNLTLLATCAALAAVLVVPPADNVHAASDDILIEVSGTAAYRQRIALPPDAVLTVRIEDVSRADAQASVLAESSQAFGDRQVPIPFTLAVLRAAIDARSTYAVRATITVGGQLRFTTTRHYPVLTREASNRVDLMLEAVLPGTSRPGLDAKSGPDATAAPSQRWRGAFRYVADAATFTNCADGRQWPVAMQEDYLTVERHYREVRRAPAAPVVITFDGRLELLPAMEGGPREHMVIAGFVGSEPDVACDSGQHLSVANLKDTYWKLIEIDGEKVQLVEGQKREVRITLASQDARVFGFSGCNQLMGGYEQEGDTLRFSKLAGTMMMCAPPLMTLERQVLKAIGETSRYRIDGEQLTLFDGDRVVARFESVYLR